MTSFANLEDKLFPKWVLLLKEEFAPMGANSFFYEMTPIHMGGKNENDRVAFPGSVWMYGYTSIFPFFKGRQLDRIGSVCFPHRYIILSAGSYWNEFCTYCLFSKLV